MTITLKTLPQATQQEVFDQGARHLLTQSKRCIDPSVHVHLGHASNCAYRFEGAACVGGCFIGDDEYLPTMEGNGWDQLFEKGMVPEDHNGFIHELQLIHDTFDPKDWPLKLTRLAEGWSLDCGVVNELEEAHKKRLMDRLEAASND